MIEREPLKRAPNPGRKPEEAVLHNRGARSGLAALPPALERRTVGLQEPALGESRLICGLEFTVTVKAESAGHLATELRQILQELGLAEAVRVE